MTRILIVNDIPSVNMLMARNFEAEGFSVDTVLTGKEGIARAKQARYDIVLLDYKLPDIDGGQVCRAIKGEEGSKGVPIYFISALDKNTLEKVIADTGAEGYIDIAMDVGTLVEMIKTITGSRGHG